MQFNVATLLSEPIGATREYEIDEVAPIEGAPHRVTGSVEFVRTDRGVLVRADLRAEAELECRRCLVPFTAQRPLRFSDEYLQAVDLTSGTRVVNELEPEALTIDARHTLDVLEAVRQYWVIEESMHPLCREDCAGICPTCGANRNEQPCGCDTTVDSRWVALSELASTPKNPRRR